MNQQVLSWKLRQVPGGRKRTVYLKVLIISSWGFPMGNRNKEIIWFWAKEYTRIFSQKIALKWKQKMGDGQAFVHCIPGQSLSWKKIERTWLAIPKNLSKSGITRLWHCVLGFITQTNGDLRAKLWKKMTKVNSMFCLIQLIGDATLTAID